MTIFGCHPEDERSEDEGAPVNQDEILRSPWLLRMTAGKLCMNEKILKIGRQWTADMRLATKPLLWLFALMPALMR